LYANRETTADQAVIADIRVKVHIKEINSKGATRIISLNDVISLQGINYLIITDDIRVHHYIWPFRPRTFLVAKPSVIRQGGGQGSSCRLPPKVFTQARQSKKRYISLQRLVALSHHGGPAEHLPEPLLR
jgi:hypothetical protein